MKSEGRRPIRVYDIHYVASRGSQVTEFAIDCNISICCIHINAETGGISALICIHTACTDINMYTYGMY